MNLSTSEEWRDTSNNDHFLATLCRDRWCHQHLLQYCVLLIIVRDTTYRKKNNIILARQYMKVCIIIFSTNTICMTWLVVGPSQNCGMMKVSEDIYFYIECIFFEDLDLSIGMALEPCNFLFHIIFGKIFFRDKRQNLWSVVMLVRLGMAICYCFDQKWNCYCVWSFVVITWNMDILLCFLFVLLLFCLFLINFLVYCRQIFSSSCRSVVWLFKKLN